MGAAGSLILPFPAIVRAQGQNGVALVIGNSKYQWEAQLPNVKRDVPDVAKTFQAMGLKTELVQDASQSTMQEAIAKFGSAARNASFAAFYFAGHGTQWAGNAFLVPVDADLSTAKTEGLVSTRLANTACNGARANMRIYDNCRNNPADGWQQKQAEDSSLIKGTQLAAFAKDNRNSVAIFSTAPGRVALDGPAGQNSPFAAALLRQLDTESVDVSTLAQKLRRDVVIATQGRQIVVDYSSYDSPMVIKGARLGRPAVGTASGNDIVGLDKAYAHAAANGILLPPGLVAIRGGNNAAVERKLGAYKYTMNWDKSSPSNQILIVLAGDPDGSPEFIVSGPSNQGWWRFVKGKISGESLEYHSYDGVGSPFTEFKWRDANSGKVDVSWPKMQRPRSPISTTFERLDG